VGVAAGIPAAAAAAASTGGTASTARSGTSYNSVATATAGRVIIGDQQVPLPNIITAKTGDSPQEADLGSSDLDNELSGVPTLGQDVIDSLNATTHGTGAYLIDTKAAASADGTSSACAGFLTGDCDVSGGSEPVQINLAASDLLTSGVLSTLPAAVQPVVKNLSSALSSYYLVLTVSGPRATCTAGSEGSGGSDFTATQNLATVAVDIRNSSGDSILPAPVSVRSGDVLSALLGAQEKLPPQVSTLLNALENADPGLISTTIEPGYTEKTGTGPKTVGTAGELGLTVEGSRVLYLKGAQAVCGPDTAAAATVTPPATPTAPAGGGTTASGTTSSEIPLGGGIQTDEGRWTGGSDAPLWIGAVGGAAALAAGAGGTVLWRRRTQGL
jgi:hypothetical protein